MTDDQIQSARTYLCRIKCRPTSPTGGELKPEVAALEGRCYWMRPMWVCEEEEQYAGEWAMMLLPASAEHPISWIASGDVEVLQERIDPRATV